MPSISGFVYDDTGSPVAGRVVRAYRRDTGDLIGSAVSADGSLSEVAARYWRLYISAKNVGGNLPSVFSMYYSLGGSDLNTSAKTYAASDIAFGNGPEKAFDGDVADGWMASSVPCWLSIDFGSIVTVDAVGFNQNTTQLDRFPKDFIVQKSSNNVDWQNILTVTGFTGWANNVRQNFNFPPAGDLGEFSISTSYTGECYVVCLDDTSGVVYNDLIHRTTPV